MTNLRLRWARFLQLAGLRRKFMWGQPPSAVLSSKARRQRLQHMLFPALRAKRKDLLALNYKQSLISFNRKSAIGNRQFPLLQLPALPLVQPRKWPPAAWLRLIPLPEACLADASPKSAVLPPPDAPACSLPPWPPLLAAENIVPLLTPATLSIPIPQPPPDSISIACSGYAAMRIHHRNT